MLKGVPSRISSDLLKALADMGHGDFLVVADDFYPPYTKTPNGVSIQAKGNSAAEMVDAILKLIPLDTQYCEHPVLYMTADSDAGMDIGHPKVWDEVTDAVVRNGYDAKMVGPIERSKFYEKAGKAYLTVCTSEQLPYGCFILQKGVL